MTNHKPAHHYMRHLNADMADLAEQVAFELAAIGSRIDDDTIMRLVLPSPEVTVLLRAAGATTPKEFADWRRVGGGHEKSPVSEQTVLKPPPTDLEAPKSVTSAQKSQQSPAASRLFRKPTVVSTHPDSTAGICPLNRAKVVFCNWT